MNEQQFIARIQLLEEQVSLLAAQCYANRIWATQLAVMNPVAEDQLMRLPEMVRTSLMFRPMPDVKIEQAVEAVQTMCGSLQAWHLGIAVTRVQSQQNNAQGGAESPQGG